MIDWTNLGANAFWIAGLVLALAALSYAAWESSLKGEKIRTRLRMRGYQALLMAAGTLFCVGLGLTARNTWEMILWLGLAALFLIQIAAALWAPERKDDSNQRKKQKK